MLQKVSTCTISTCRQVYCGHEAARYHIRDYTFMCRGRGLHFSGNTPEDAFRYQNLKAALFLLSRRPDSRDNRRAGGGSEGSSPCRLLPEHGCGYRSRGQLLPCDGEAGSTRGCRRPSSPYLDCVCVRCASLVFSVVLAKVFNNTRDMPARPGTTRIIWRRQQVMRRDFVSGQKSRNQMVQGSTQTRKPARGPSWLAGDTWL